jgi:RNA-directed DNA polymerase
MGTPQGGNASPILANIYLHYVLDEWFEETVRTYCTGHAYLCRYADDFVCAFQHDKDAQRFYKTLIRRLARFGLEVAEDKTQIIAFSHCKAMVKTKFDFLGFEFRWCVGRSRKPILILKTAVE